jgi:membrane-bound lytic murein transglycosylase B
MISSTLKTGRYLNLIILFLVVVTLFGASFSVGVNVSEAQNEEQILARERELQAELERVIAEIEKQRTYLQGQKQQSSSLQKDINVLNARIAKARLELQARNIAIERLSRDIAERTNKIEDLQAKLDREKDSLAELLRQKNITDNYSLVEIMLGNEDLSEFFADMDAFSSIKVAMQASFEEIRNIQQATAAEKDNLQTQVAREADIRAEVEYEKGSIERNEAEQRRLLALSKSEERSYESVIKEREAEASRIRSALFALRDTADISFGQALILAEEVQRITGVRPAFLLSIIQQESEMGKNVGRCNRPGDLLKWRDIMPGPHDGSWRDDQSAYLRIMAELGLDPESQPLSCPLGGGWGGAMGPAQFIPATWESYKTRVSNATGSFPANPWNARDAFVASGLFLSDLGAGKGGWTAEREASCRYYSGRPCGAADNVFYGDQVMRRAQTFQQQIDFLKGR